MAHQQQQQQHHPKHQIPPSCTSRGHHRAGAAERDQWWRQSIVKRTLAFVEDDIQHVLGQSPFLLQSRPGSHIALFHRSEIRIGARLGKGGFSHVFEIVAFDLNPQYSQLLTGPQQQLREYYREQTRSGRGRYALKHLQQRLLEEPKSFQCAASDLAVEAAYMSALDHPNILSVRGLPIHGLESFSEGRHDSYFLVLDRLESTLDRKISQWRHGLDMPLLGKAGHALQLAGALDYLHQRGIMFRDLKPQNIGFTADGRLKLLDFGLCRELPVARSHPDDVFEMSGVGTRRYMAVEIVNTSYYNDKADVYSWAMVFWEMLSLERPYTTFSVEDHTSCVCQGGERPRLYKQWPLPIQNLLQHSWATSIPDRLSMKEVECLLRTYIECCRVLDDDVPESPTAAEEQHHNYDLVEAMVHQPQFVLPLSSSDDVVDYNDELQYFAADQADLHYTTDEVYEPPPQQHAQQQQKRHNVYHYSEEANDLLLKGMGSLTTQDMSSQASTADMLSIQSSVFESVATTTTANTTDVSSFDVESIAYPSSPARTTTKPKRNPKSTTKKKPRTKELCRVSSF
ncbi:hypothetical protein ACA910_013352 [Epithemia clementina (nom. ined.)]